MKSKVWLKEKLADLAAEFKGAEFRYGYEQLSETHFINVVPEDLLTADESFNLLRFDLLKDFYAQFPSESVVFLAKEDQDEFNDYEDFICGNNFLDDCLSWLNTPSMVNLEVTLSHKSQTNAVVHNDVIKDSDYALAA